MTAEEIIENLPMILESIGQIIVAILNLWVTFASNMLDLYKRAWEAIKSNVLSPIANWIRDKVITPISNFFTNLWAGVVNAASNTWAKVKNVFSTVGSFFSGIWDTIKTKFTTIGTNIASAISGAVKSGINGVITLIENTVNRAVRLINGAIGLINKIPGVNIGTIAELQMPRLAKGGIVDKSTIANVGEDGAEAIVPLERNTGWMDAFAEKLRNVMAETKGDGDTSLADKIDELIELIRNLKIYLDTGRLVGGLAPAINGALGDINALDARGV